MSETAKVTDFSHLERLEDGGAKAKTARVAVDSLKSQIRSHQELLEEQELIDERRIRSVEEQRRNSAIQTRLSELRADYFRLLGEDAQRRGYSLESLMKAIFDLFDLDPKSSFKQTGSKSTERSLSKIRIISSKQNGRTD